MEILQEKQEKQEEILKKALDSIFSLPVTSSPYTWVARKEFAKISKILNQGITFKTLYKHLAEHNLLPKNGNADSLKQAYYREKKRKK